MVAEGTIDAYEEDMNLEVGTEEAPMLKPAKVKIEKVEIQPIQDNKKVVCYVKHPEKEELIQISSLKFERNKKLEVAGTWISKDSEGKIRKNSALAVLMEKLGAKTIKELEGKEADTIEDDKGYLCFKCY